MADIKNTEPAYYTNRAIAYLKLSQFANARNDCKAALRIDEKFSKAYNRLSKCNIALGELAEASINLQKSIEIEPDNPVNKKDQKLLTDLKITESLVHKAVKEENFDKAVTNLNELLKECRSSVDMICLKIECMLKAFQFDEANKYSADIMKESDEWANHPRLLCWRGKVLYYNGNEVLGQKHFK